MHERRSFRPRRPSSDRSAGDHFENRRTGAGRGRGGIFTKTVGPPGAKVKKCWPPPEVSRERISRPWPGDHRLILRTIEPTTIHHRGIVRPMTVTLPRSLAEEDRHIARR